MLIAREYYPGCTDVHENTKPDVKYYPDLLRIKVVLCSG
jgi:hypothetical protein